jgi:predicted acylesterase/phospholipase RssA
MGAVITGGAARDMTIDEMRQLSRKVFVEGRPLQDPTLPVMALLSGRRIANLARDAFGDWQVEDMPITAFTVSADITHGELVLHRTGDMVLAMLASAALPGVFPPIVRERGLLVDGGVLNNVPTDLMADLCGGPTIAVDAGSEIEVFAGDTGLPTAWEVVRSRLDPRAQAIRAPLIAETVQRALTLASTQRVMENRRRADLFLKPALEGVRLLGFDDVDTIVEAGYRYAADRLKQFEAEGRIENGRIVAAAHNQPPTPPRGSPR